MKKALPIAIFAIILVAQLRSQSSLDSALYQRNITYSDYYEFKQAMKERTWINMVNLTTKANEVIKIDNAIINFHLYTLIKENKKFKIQLEQIKSEVLLLKKEAEVQGLILEERRFLYNIMIITIATLSLLFLIVLVLFINRQIGYQGLKTELRNAYARSDERPETNHSELEKLSKENEEIKKDKQKLSSKVSLLNEALQKKELELEKEISSKKEVENQIRDLLKQIKAFQR